MSRNADRGNASTSNPCSYSHLAQTFHRKSPQRLLSPSQSSTRPIATYSRNTPGIWKLLPQTLAHGAPRTDSKDQLFVNSNPMCLLWDIRIPISGSSVTAVQPYQVKSIPPPLKWLFNLLELYLSHPRLDMPSNNRSFNKRAGYWQPAALKPKIILTDGGDSHHDLDDKRKSGQEVFEMGFSKVPTHTLKSMGHVAPSVSQKEDSIELKRPMDEVVPLTKLKLGFIILALCLAVFLVALDQTIIATAVPKITDEFKAMDDVGW